ncbi:hypothetical protein EV182_000726 [Spiromyces aspiralis]|uniref:Uncharacterized protein n=1 Tax=Spiromyces aspiralis TaxID=68401 RepID=A0ACC1HKP0_9FUNG|nr:hypothetical protein EV182_000726 [Spiromyces aspiralis]
MKNPYEEQQTAILTRIINNVAKLNDTLQDLNTRLEEINELNTDLVAFSNIWQHYQRNAAIYLHSTSALQPPKYESTGTHSDGNGPQA